MIEKLIYKNSLAKLAVIVIVAIIFSVMFINFGLLIRFVVDNQHAYDSSTIVWMFIGCFILIRGIMPICYTLLQYSISLFAIDKEKNIREFYFNLIKNISFDRLSSVNKSEMLSAYNISMSAINNYIRVIFLEFVPCIVEAILVVITLSYYIGIKFGCLVAVIILSFSAITIKLIKNRIKFIKQSARSYKELNDIFHDTIFTLESSKIFQALQKSTTRYKKNITNFVSSQKAERNQFLNFGFIITGVSVVFCFVILFYAKIKMDNGDMSIGELVMLANYLFVLFQPISRACMSVKDYKRCKIDFKLIEEFLQKNKVNLTEQQETNIDIKKSFRVINKIEFTINGLKKTRKDCTINYTDQKISFQKDFVSFLTGRNGIGKSTLAKIIIGLDLIHDGKLETNIKHDKINYVYMPQKMVFINDTIINNLLHYTNTNNLNLFKKTLDDLNFTKDLNFVVGNLGDKLSGGEQQKLAVAIALLNEPDCLILDEPTNSVDVETINSLYHKIEEIKQSMIVVIISHNTEFINRFINKKIYNIDNTLITK